MVTPVFQQHLRALDIHWPVSLQELKTAMRLQAKVWHPDRFTEKSMREAAHTKLKQVNAAYDALTDLIEKGHSSVCHWCGQPVDSRHSLCETCRFDMAIPDSLRNELRSREETLTRERNDLLKREKALSHRHNELIKRDAALSRCRNMLVQREETLRHHQYELAQREHALTAWEQRLVAKAQATAQRRTSPTTTTTQPNSPEISPQIDIAGRWRKPEMGGTIHFSGTGPRYEVIERGILNETGRGWAWVDGDCVTLLVHHTLYGPCHGVLHRHADMLKGHLTRPVTGEQPLILVR